MLSRRALFKSVGALAGTTMGERSVTAQRSSSPRVIATDAHAVVDTTAGKVRGYLELGVFTFKGIPYGASTAGPGRFMAPTRPTPWPGIRDTIRYGPACPQGYGRWSQTNDHLTFLLEHENTLQDEDCLRLNIWTPGIRDTRRRPVMFWLHGGGFAAGSASEFPSCDGRNLAERGDVVVVSINHRLNILGFINLSEFGERYANASNAGLLDIVSALEWVRDNITNFGGDPGNVTVFGQSGGGAKVNCLLAMPSARGLLHRAAVMSASPAPSQYRIHQQTVAGGLAAVGALELNAGSIGQIQTMPLERVMAAAGAMLGAIQGYLGPTIDERTIPSAPFDSAAPSISADIPLLVGNTLDEGSPIVSPRETMTREELRDEAAKMHGSHAATLLVALDAVYPSAKPVELFGHLRGGLERRVQSVRQATLKSLQGPAKAYVYVFAWHTSVLNGRPRAFHRSELPFVFANTDRCATLTGGTDGARVLGGRVSDAWIQFARTGNPNHKGLPPWPAFTNAGVETMVLDNQCAVKRNHDLAARRAWEAASAKRP